MCRKAHRKSRKLSTDICFQGRQLKIVFIHLKNISDSQGTDYRFYPKYLDALTPYHTCSKFCKCLFYYFLKSLKIAVANSVDPDQTPRSAVSDLGLHCLQMSFLRDTRHKWDKVMIMKRPFHLLLER